MVGWTEEEEAYPAVVVASENQWHNGNWVERFSVAVHEGVEWRWDSAGGAAGDGRGRVQREMMVGGEVLISLRRKVEGGGVHGRNRRCRSE